MNTLQKQLKDVAKELVDVYLIGMLSDELACDIITGQCDEWLVDQIASLLEHAVDSYNPRANFSD